MAFNLSNPISINDSVNSLLIDNFSSDEARKIIYIDNHRIDSNGGTFMNKVEPMPEPYYSAIYSSASSYAGGADIHGAVIQTILDEISIRENITPLPVSYSINAFSIDITNMNMLVSYYTGSGNKDFLIEGSPFMDLINNASTAAGADVYAALKHGLYSELSNFYGMTGTIV